MADPILTVRKLTKSFYLHGNNASVEGCRDVSFEVGKGAITVMSGKSGSGKSSILKCIYRTYKPDSGSILLRLSAEDSHSLDLATASDQQVLKVRQQYLSFASQFLWCLPRKSAWAVVARPLLLQGIPVAEAKEQAMAALRRVGLKEPLWTLPPATFSGGERQRVNMARCIAMAPTLLVLDEPTASLDPASRDHILQLIKELAQQGMAILAAIHHPESIAKVADTHIDISQSSVSGVL